MPVYCYKAKKMDGTQVNGTMEAAEYSSLVHLLREDGLYVYYMLEKNDSPTGILDSKLGIKQIAIFCSQMSAMLKAGIPIAGALGISGKSISDKKMKKAVELVCEQVQKGQEMSQSMKKTGKKFPAFLIYMIETGETSGALDEIMEKMAAHYEQEAELRGKIRTALIYPCILAITAAIVTIFMLTFVLPQFFSLFGDMELPALTRFLIAVSLFLTRHWFSLLTGICVFAGMCYLLMSKDAFRLMVHGWMLQIPGIGALLKTIYTYRFASAFSLLYGSGVGILKSLDVSGRVMGNRYAGKQLELVSEKISSGIRLYEALEDTEVFRQMFISMVMVGEESGSLEEIMVETGDVFRKEASTAISQLIALLEPMMIIIMGGIVGVIVLSIMLPIFQTYSYMV